MNRILVIDDDRSIHVRLEKALKIEESREVFFAISGEDGLRLARTCNPDVILLDIMLPEVNGLELFRQLQAVNRKVPILFMTAEAGSGTAIAAMQLGAFDFVSKPLHLPKLLDIVSRALETRNLMNKPVALPVGSATSGLGDEFVGRSPQMLEVFKQIGRVAKQRIPVLIRGESGCGKELVARALYQYSDRSDAPFMAVNCAAIPDQLLESELFGHEKGSFTSADRRRIGKFEQCNGGTIFLDEVGDMAPLVQGKVLRVLQEQHFERVGGNQTIETDVRIIAATNRDLESMVSNDSFRSDLLYRLNGVTIHLPSLRDRVEDIPRLVEYFLNRLTREMNKHDIEGIAPSALELLLHYSWPGNVRELQSVVRQCLLNATGTVIDPGCVPAHVREAEPQVEKVTPVTSATGVFASPRAETLAPITSPTETIESGEARDVASVTSDVCNVVEFVEQRLKGNSTNLYAEVMELVERYLLSRVLQETEGNQSRAAEILGITRGKVRDRIATFKIQLERTVSVGE